MKAVYKYEIPIEDEFTLVLPKGARLLCIQAQRDTPCLWALVDTLVVREARHFRLAGTGHPIENPESLSFIDTFQMHGGASVFHVFERIK